MSKEADYVGERCMGENRVIWLFFILFLQILCKRTKIKLNFIFLFYLFPRKENSKLENLEATLGLYFEKCLATPVAYKNMCSAVPVKSGLKFLISTCFMP